jgi:archaemetzincin
MLPGDHLASDPDAYTQSFQEWKDGKHRNPIIASRRTIYVVQSPEIDPEVEFMREWSTPLHSHNFKRRNDTKHPQPNDIRDYLAAFYRGLEVKILSPSDLCFVSWELDPSKRKTGEIPEKIGLLIGDTCHGIRARPAPDNIYKAQLYIPDLLTSARDLLPSDAYALLFLTNIDLYEDETDIFTCGRAYGSLRVAAVSTARYNPTLDDTHNIDRQHSWPASHCEAYMTSHLAHEPKRPRPNTTTRSAQIQSTPLDPPTSPMKRAISKYRSLTPLWPLSSQEQSALWLGRICRTASHELGHCFGIAHCVYYACSMQGSASVCEDARQPPYLCPVDLAKVVCATSSSAEGRYRALLAFCERDGLRDSLFFAPYAAWMRGRSEEGDLGGEL